MNGLVSVAFILAMIVAPSSAAWCICKDGQSDAVLQKTLDYACGAGADCTQIHQNGACFNPNTVRAHCSYAVNSYFQKKGQAQGSCDFAGTAIPSASDPSSTGCVYPSSASSTGTSATPVTTTPSSTTPSTTTPSTTTPSTTTPSTTTTTPIGGSPYLSTPTGVLGPSGTGINNDVSHGGLVLQQTSLFSSSLILIMCSAFMLLWG